MNIAHFIHRYPPALGGAESYFDRLSKFLVAQRHQVSVFTSNAIDLTAFWSPSGKCLPKGIEVVDQVTIHRYPLWRVTGRKFLLKPLSLLPHLRWQCLTLPCNPISFSMWNAANNPNAKYDLVHATAFPYAFPLVCALTMARKLKVPFFLTPFLHLGDPTDPFDPVRKAYTSPALFSLIQQADKVFVQTESEKQALLDRNVPLSKIILQGMGVDPSECTRGAPDQIRAEWGIPQEVPIIGHLANNSEEKGTCDLLRAAKILWQNGKNFRVLLAGSEMPNFQKYWPQFQGKGRVLRLGRIPEDQKKHFFAAIDIFALPSRSDSFGLVLLEAWANGVPNVGYRAGGIADVIRHEIDGLLVPCGDIANLAQALEKLIENRQLRNKYGIAGRNRIDTEYNWNEKLSLVEAEYKQEIMKLGRTIKSVPTS